VDIAFIAAIAALFALTAALALGCAKLGGRR
jgi:hypothetical protein